MCNFNHVFENRYFWYKEYNGIKLDHQRVAKNYSYYFTTSYFLNRLSSCKGEVGYILDKLPVYHRLNALKEFSSST